MPMMYVVCMYVNVYKMCLLCACVYDVSIHTYMHVWYVWCLHVSVYDGCRYV